MRSPAAYARGLDGALLTGCLGCFVCLFFACVYSISTSCTVYPPLAPVHDFAAMLNDDPLGTIRKQGYLTKKPLHGHLLSNSRRRFFLLYDNALEWRASEHSPHKGRLPLAGASILRRDAELIITSAGEQLVLHGDDLEDWEARVHAAVLDLRGSGRSSRRAFNTPHTFAPKIECVIRTPHTHAYASALTRPCACALRAAGTPPTQEAQHRFLDAAKTHDWSMVFALLESEPSLIDCNPSGRWSALHRKRRASPALSTFLRNAFQLMVLFTLFPLSQRQPRREMCWRCTGCSSTSTPPLTSLRAMASVRWTSLRSRAAIRSRLRAGARQARVRAARNGHVLMIANVRLLLHPMPLMLAGAVLGCSKANVSGRPRHGSRRVASHLPLRPCCVRRHPLGRSRPPRTTCRSCASSGKGPRKACGGDCRRSMSPSRRL
jgi:hypothetical protein